MRGAAAWAGLTLHVDLLFIGDAAFDEAMITDGELAGIDADLVRARETYRQIEAWADLRPTVVLPAHDWGAPERLRAGTTPPFGAPLP